MFVGRDLEAWGLSNQDKIETRSASPASQAENETAGIVTNDTNSSEES